MKAWIPTTKNLPPHNEWVEILLEDDSTTIARIVDNYFSESVWKTHDKKVAHFRNYTAATRKKYQILTQPDFRAPKAWRKLKYASNT